MPNINLTITEMESVVKALQHALSKVKNPEVKPYWSMIFDEVLISALFDGIEIHSKEEPNLTEEQKERFEKIQKALIELAEQPKEN